MEFIGHFLNLLIWSGSSVQSVIGKKIETYVLKSLQLN